MTSEARILVVTESLGIGGTESHLIRLLPLLAARGFEIATFCMTERGSRAGSICLALISSERLSRLLDVCPSRS